MGKTNSIGNLKDIEFDKNDIALTNNAYKIAIPFIRNAQTKKEHQKTMKKFEAVMAKLKPNKANKSPANTEKDAEIARLQAELAKKQNAKK